MMVRSRWCLRCWAMARAVLLLSRKMASPSATRRAPAAPMRLFLGHLLLAAQGQGEARPGRPPAGTAPPWVRTTRLQLGQRLQVAADGHLRDAELLAQLGYRGSSALLDAPEDFLAPFLEEEVWNHLDFPSYAFILLWNERRVKYHGANSAGCGPAGTATRCSHAGSQIVTHSFVRSSSGSCRGFACPAGVAENSW